MHKQHEKGELMHGGVNMDGTFAARCPTSARLMKPKPPAPTLAEIQQRLAEVKKKIDALVSRK